MHYYILESISGDKDTKPKMPKTAKTPKEPEAGKG